MQSLFVRFFSKTIRHFLSEITLTHVEIKEERRIRLDQRTERERDSRAARRFSSGRRGTLFFWGKVFLETLSSKTYRLLLFFFFFILHRKTRVYRKNEFD
jgi:hypothetical protein